MQLKYDLYLQEHLTVDELLASCLWVDKRIALCVLRHLIKRALCVLVFVAEMLNADNVLALGTYRMHYTVHTAAVWCSAPL